MDLDAEKGDIGGQDLATMTKAEKQNAKKKRRKERERLARLGVEGSDQGAMAPQNTTVMNVVGENIPGRFSVCLD
jgi:hypothetical protein